MKDGFVRIVGLIADEKKFVVTGIDERDPKKLYWCVLPPSFAAPLQEVLKYGPIYLSLEGESEFLLHTGDDRKPSEN